MEKSTVSKFDAHPMANVQNIQDVAVGPAKFISLLDLVQGCWQVPRLLIPDYYIYNPIWLVEFIVIPFGLDNAPATLPKDRE